MILRSLHFPEPCQSASDHGPAPTSPTPFVLSERDVGPSPALPALASWEAVGLLARFAGVLVSAGHLMLQVLHRLNKFRQH